MSLDPNWIMQTITLLALGAISYFIKGAMSDIKKGIAANDLRVKELDLKHTQNYSALKDELNDLKSDLPLIFVLKEDFIRTLNNVEGKIGNIDTKIDQLIRMNLQRGDKNG